MWNLVLFTNAYFLENLQNCVFGGQSPFIQCSAYNLTFNLKLIIFRPKMNKRNKMRLIYVVCNIQEWKYKPE